MFVAAFIVVTLAVAPLDGLIVAVEDGDTRVVKLALKELTATAASAEIADSRLIRSEGIKRLLQSCAAENEDCGDVFLALDDLPRTMSGHPGRAGHAGNLG